PQHVPACHHCALEMMQEGTTPAFKPPKALP
ncbi:MAG: hypothetical protein ACI84R_003719, partial [Candidatus Azotimanducaceae bacterium]